MPQNLMGLFDIERSPYVSELQYFAQNPNVAGMKTEDQRVILRPDLFGRSRDAVLKNEYARLLMQDYKPKSLLTDQQHGFFRGTPYQHDPDNAMRSVFARLLTGDPSVRPSFQQDSELRRMKQMGGLLGMFGDQ